MFTRPDLELIRDSLQHAKETEPDILGERMGRLNDLLARTVEHVDYLCPDCDGTGIDPDSRNRKKANGKHIPPEPCVACEGTGRDAKWRNTMRIFGSSDMMTTGRSDNSTKIGEVGI